VQNSENIKELGLKEWIEDSWERHKKQSIFSNEYEEKEAELAYFYGAIATASYYTKKAEIKAELG
jgi:Fe-S oxidoreductase